MKVKSETKGLRERLKFLGAEYSIKVIDLEKVIYRKINDYFDIEISGVNNNRSKTFQATVFVWRLKPEQHVVETHQFSDMALLKDGLESLVGKYQGLK